MPDILLLQDTDPYFKEELAQEPGCEHLWRCFSCGVCTAVCPVSQVEPGFSPSLILRQVFHGLREQLLSSPALWYCLRCARCSFQCPQDVRFLDIIQGLQHLAVRHGYLTPERLRLLSQAEHLVQELRRRLIGAILTGPEDLDLRAVLKKLTEDSRDQEKSG